MKRKGRAKRARQYMLEEDGLIRQRATGKPGIPASLRQDILQEVHDSPQSVVTLGLSGLPPWCRRSSTERG